MLKIEGRAWFGMVLGVALLGTACGDDGPLPLIAIGNTWRELGNEQHTFTFIEDDDDNATPRTTGIFHGFETPPEGTVDFDLTGDWSDGRVRFTVERSPAVTYTARFTHNDPDTLNFTSNEGNLTLIRN